MKKINLFLLLIVTSLIFVSCTNGANPETISSTKEGEFLRSGGVEKAINELKKMSKFKGKKIMVFQDIQFVNPEGLERIFISLSDPNKPKNIDKYEYNNGVWGDPIPVNVTGGDWDLDANLTDLNDINYKGIPKMIKILENKAKSIEGGKVGESFTYRYEPSRDIPRFFQMYVEGTRESYIAIFEGKNGKLIEFNKN